MKKVLLTLSTALAMICSLCACGNRPNNDSSTVTEINFIERNADYYENGVVLDGQRAMFLDFETMEKVPLCAVPNCTHSTSDCLAKIIGSTPVFYNGYVYFFETNGGAIRETPEGHEFYIDSKLKKASLDSSEIEVVCEFSDCAPDYGYEGLVLKGNELYFVADDLNPTTSEYEVYDYSNSGGTHFLCSIDLDTGEYTNYGSIYDGDKEYDGAAYSSCANITGIYKDKMYIRYSFIKDNDALQSSDNPEELYEHLNFEFDFETREWKEAELPFSWSMNPETYTYYDKEAELMHVIYKDKETTFSCDRANIGLMEYNGKLFVQLEGRFYDLADMSEHSLGEYNDYEVVGYYDDSYILTNTLDTVRLTEEELLSL